MTKVAISGERVEAFKVISHDFLNIHFWFHFFSHALGKYGNLEIVTFNPLQTE